MLKEHKVHKELLELKELRKEQQVPKEQQDFKEQQVLLDFLKVLREHKG